MDKIRVENQDNSSPEIDKRRTRVIQQSVFLHSGFEDDTEHDVMSNENYECSNTLVDDENIESENEDTFCDQLRELTPTKIDQLLSRLELNELNLNDEIVLNVENDQMEENKTENVPKKKGKALKKDTKNLKINKVNDETIKEPVVDQVERTKTEKPKRGKKEADKVDDRGIKLIEKQTVQSIEKDSVSELVKEPSKSSKNVRRKNNDAEATVLDEKMKDLDTKVIAKKNAKKTNETTNNVEKDNKQANKKDLKITKSSGKEKLSRATKKTNSDPDECKDVITIEGSLKPPQFSDETGKPKAVKASKVSKKSPQLIDKLPQLSSDIENTSDSSRKRNKKSPLKVQEEKNEKDETQLASKEVDKSQNQRALKTNNKSVKEELGPQNKNLLLKSRVADVPKKNKTDLKPKLINKSHDKENEGNNTKAKAKTEPIKKKKAVDGKEKIKVEEVVTKRVTRSNK